MDAGGVEGTELQYFVTFPLLYHELYPGEGLCGM